MIDYYSVDIFCFTDIICWVPLRLTQLTGESDRTTSLILGWAEAQVSILATNELFILRRNPTSRDINLSE